MPRATAPSAARPPPLTVHSRHPSEAAPAAFHAPAPLTPVYIPTVTCVIPGVLYLSSYGQLKDVDTVRRARITAFLSVAKELREPLPPYVTAEDLHEGRVRHMHLDLSDSISQQLVRPGAVAFPALPGPHPDVSFGLISHMDDGPPSASATPPSYPRRGPGLRELPLDCPTESTGTQPPPPAAEESLSKDSKDSSHRWGSNTSHTAPPTLPVPDHPAGHETPAGPKPSAMAEAIGFIDQCRRDGLVTVVYCQAGISRSVSIAVAYLMRECGAPFSTALEMIRRRRPIADPNAEFCLQLATCDVARDLPPLPAEFVSPAGEAATKAAVQDIHAALAAAIAADESVNPHTTLGQLSTILDGDHEAQRVLHRFSLEASAHGAAAAESAALTPGEDDPLSVPSSHTSPATTPGAEECLRDSKRGRGLTASRDPTPTRRGGSAHKPSAYTVHVMSPLGNSPATSSTELLLHSRNPSRRPSLGPRANDEPAQEVVDTVGSGLPQFTRPPPLTVADGFSLGASPARELGVPTTLVVGGHSLRYESPAPSSAAPAVSRIAEAVKRATPMLPPGLDAWGLTPPARSPGLSPKVGGAVGVEGSSVLGVPAALCIGRFSVSRDPTAPTAAGSLAASACLPARVVMERRVPWPSYLEGASTC